MLGDRHCGILMSATITLTRTVGIDLTHVSGIDHAKLAHHTAVIQNAGVNRTPIAYVGL